MENLGKKIIEIERNIMSITGTNVDNFFFLDKKSEKVANVRELLEERQHILNKMFVPTEENMSHFKETNERLYSLTCALFERVQKLEQSKSMIMDCPDFDDDYLIEGTLRFCYNDDESVLSLSDDELYGSNFKIMINLISALSHDTYAENIEDFNPDSSILDDGKSWFEYPFRGREEFNGIIICHAVHQLTDHQLYSIPDLLRLNDFWTEANFKIQSITDIKGNRWKPILS